MILASSKDSEGEAITVNDLSDLQNIKNTKEEMLAIVINGEFKKYEQYKYQGGSWIIDEINWAEIYLEFSSHAGIPPDVLEERSLPFIQAIRPLIGKHVAMKIGIPFSSGMDSEAHMNNENNSNEYNRPGQTPIIDDIIGFCGGFNGDGG
jgi:hypothetical protein